jgi:hypothetical protein
MIAVQSLEEEARYSPLLENWTNQTSFLCPVNICRDGKREKCYLINKTGNIKCSKQED